MTLGQIRDIEDLGVTVVACPWFVLRMYMQINIFIVLWNILILSGINSWSPLIRA